MGFDVVAYQAAEDLDEVVGLVRLVFPQELVKYWAVAVKVMRYIRITRLDFLRYLFPFGNVYSGGFIYRLDFLDLSKI